MGGKSGLAAPPVADSGCVSNRASDVIDVVTIVEA
jgi:hypothetical protein